MNSSGGSRTSAMRGRVERPRRQRERAAQRSAFAKAVALIASTLARKQAGGLLAGLAEPLGAEAVGHARWFDALPSADRRVHLAMVFAASEHAPRRFGALMAEAGGTLRHQLLMLLPQHQRGPFLKLADGPPGDVVAPMLAAWADRLVRETTYS